MDNETERKPERTLAPEALYQGGESFYIANHFINPHGDHIWGIEKAGERMQQLDPDGSRARALLLEMRGEHT